MFRTDGRCLIGGSPDSTEFALAGALVGPGRPTFVIAEVGLAHDGSLGAAHAFVDAAAGAGVSAVKFQTHIAPAESTPHEPFRTNVFPQDRTRWDYWTRTAFTRDQWRTLADHARRMGLAFLSSPFSFEAVDWLLDCGVPAWKVASGEVGNLPLLDRLARTHLPVLLSSGMSDWAELDEAVGVLRRGGAEFAVFQCTTAYPCGPEAWGLNVLDEIRRRYGCPVGLSDHSGTIAPSLAAVTLGADLLEFHVTFDRKAFGPDTSASLTFEQATELVAMVRSLERALASPVDKDAAARDKQSLREIFCKSIVPARDLPAGTVLTADDLAVKKPGTGIPARLWDQVLGQRLARPVARDELIALDDLREA